MKIINNNMTIHKVAFHVNLQCSSNIQSEHKNSKCVDTSVTYHKAFYIFKLYMYTSSVQVINLKNNMLPDMINMILKIRLRKVSVALSGSMRENLLLMPYKPVMTCNIILQNRLK